MGVVRDQELKLEEVNASHALGAAGEGLPKERELTRRREGCECEGGVCAREAIGAPSKLRLIRRPVSLARMLSRRPTV